MSIIGYTSILCLAQNNLIKYFRINYPKIVIDMFLA